MLNFARATRSSMPRQADSADEVRDLLREVERNRGTVLRPGDPIQRILGGTKGTQPLAVHLSPGIYHLNRSMLTASVAKLRLFGHGQVVLQRIVRIATPMLTVTANDVWVDGVEFDDNAGVGDAVRFRNNSLCVIARCRIYAGPGGGVPVGDGIFAENSDRLLVQNCVVDDDATRPTGEIWYDDNSQNGRIIGNDALGGLISYLGVSGTVAAANIPAATVR